MNTCISQQIAVLSDLNKAQLLTTWSQNFNQNPSSTLRKEPMVPILAYRIQEKE